MSGLASIPVIFWVTPESGTTAQYTVVKECVGRMFGTSISLVRVQEEHGTVCMITASW